MLDAHRAVARPTPKAVRELLGAKMWNPHTQAQAQGAEEAASAKLDAAYQRRLRQERVTAEAGEDG